MTWEFGVFLVLGVLALLVEIRGINDPDKDDTITEGFRKLLSILPKWAAYPLLFLVVGLLAWTIGHFLEGWL